MNDLKMLLNKDYKILSIEEGILSYMKLSSIIPYAYPKDTLSLNDIILYINTRSGIPSDIFSALEIDAPNDIPSASKNDNTVILTQVDNSRVQEIIKINQDFSDSNSLIDTIFNGHSICVLVDKNESVASLTIDSFSLPSDYCTGVTELLLVFNDKGMKMYIGDDHDKICDCLSTRSFESYFDVKHFSKQSYYIFEVFDKLITDAIVSCIECNDLYQIDLGNNQLILKPSFLEDNQIKINFYNQEKVYDKIIKYSKLYERLTKGSKSKIDNSALNTTFNLWGDDEKTKEMHFLLQKSCGTDVTIMLTGESGTGKTYLARKIHESSKRANNAFIHVNCAAIPYNLLESELFGYDDGAFTGAKKGGKVGFFEMADEGTLFLDEITEIPFSLQGKLLEAIQNRSFFRVGGTQKIKANIRIIAATNKNLKTLVAENKFREDLYYRLNVFQIEIPPLRDRIESLEYIASDILPEVSYRCGVNPLRLSTQALEKIKFYSWPGNIREFENILEKAVILSDGKIIMPEDIILPETADSFIPIDMSLKEQRDLWERDIIIKTLKKFNWDRTKTAQYLDIGRTSLFEKIKKYNLMDIENEEQYDY